LKTQIYNSLLIAIFESKSEKYKKENTNDK